ncbi:MAG: hypothetical protein GTO51_10040 [Candidatus Latescibacteria bacterium]|nr:hypothetical protein [Candidatus Latescibacterota bacterium]NIM66308.1 hypothetical protein [Candidatus Latescibacterota bacterium]NIO02787.1 hypothetical protein [Candidatus Latescibacterota bacterium]NIO29922.1 hypothetical protein [Candidatus Latescibacterota bacterium]NIO57537.1 hypothetical protein [Candidatus Latescibacterota bacterium]
MSKLHRSRGFQIAVNRVEIARVLGYRRSRIPKRVRVVLDEIEPTAREFVSPACVYRYMVHEELSQSEYLRCLDQVVLCLVTIGGRLEEEVERYKHEGDLSRALILDTYGSAAAEAAADAAEMMIQREISCKELKCSSRFSPGYGEWDVVEQRWILPALQSESLGVHLTEGCMMVPRKSITFAVTYGETPVSLRDEGMCEVCGMVNCRFKRMGGEHPETRKEK